MDEWPPRHPWPAPVQRIGWAYAPIALVDAGIRARGPLLALHGPAGGPDVVVADSRTCRTLLRASSREGDGPSPNEVLRPIVGAGSVLTLVGAEHRRARGRTRSVAGELATDSSVAATVAPAVGRWPAGGPVVLHPILRELALRVLLRTMFGAADPADRFRLAELLLLDPVRNRSHRPSPPWRHLTAASREFDELLGRLNTTGRPRDLLATLLITGHETTAAACAWTLERLARHPAVQLWTRTGPGVLARAEWAVREALRLRPVIPFISRPLGADVPLPEGVLPAGTAVALSAWHVHRDPAVFRRPAEFAPERHEHATVPGESWLPFGGGARSCVGEAFALRVASEIVAAAVRAFDLRPVGRPERPVRRSIMLVPSRGARLLLVRRSTR